MIIIGTIIKYFGPSKNGLGPTELHDVGYCIENPRHVLKRMYSTYIINTYRSSIVISQYPANISGFIIEECDSDIKCKNTFDELIMRNEELFNANKWDRDIEFITEAKRVMYHLTEYFHFIKQNAKYTIDEYRKICEIKETIRDMSSLKRLLKRTYYRRGKNDR